MTNAFILGLAAFLLPAAASAATYSAKPVTPVSSTRIVVRDISWACGPAACQGSTEYSRPVVLCQALARRVGRLEQFVVDGRALSAVELDRCNRTAAGGPQPTLARN